MSKAGGARGPVDAEYVEARLAERGVHWPRPTVVASLGSTNADVMELAIGGAPEGTVIVADEQTAGRGRLGRAWISAPGAGLWVSVLLRVPSRDGTGPGLLPLLAGVAVAEAIRAQGVSASLKWPNDVIVDDPVPGRPGLRKVAGILSEGDGSGGVVVGMGVNMSQAADELPVPQATSLALEGADVSRSDLLVEILVGLHAALGDLRATGGTESMRRYRELCATVGREVKANLPSGVVISGRATGIADDGRLAIQTAEKTEYVAAGDVIHATI